MDEQDLQLHAANEMPPPSHLGRKRKASERMKGLLASFHDSPSGEEAENTDPAPTPRPHPHKKPARATVLAAAANDDALTTPAPRHATQQAAAALLAIGRSGAVPPPSTSSPALRTPLGPRLAHTSPVAGLVKAGPGPVVTPGALEVSPRTDPQEGKTAAGTPGSAAGAGPAFPKSGNAHAREFVTPVRPGFSLEAAAGAAATRVKGPKPRKPQAPAPPPRLALPLADLPQLRVPPADPAPGVLRAGAQAPKLFRDTPVKALAIPPAPTGPFYTVVTIDPYAAYRQAQTLTQRGGPQPPHVQLRGAGAGVQLSTALQQAIARLKELK